MSVPSEPKTLPEWKAYADSLKGAELREVAAAANSMSFVQVLQDQGYAPEEIHAIIHLIARRFVVLGERPPTDGFYDLQQMGKSPPPIKV